MKLVLGVGNPGRAYAATRHNVGFRCVDALAHRHGLLFTQRRSLVTLAQGVIQDKEVVLVKPRTFVNESGRAATYLLARFHVTPADLLVILDDLALPVGKVRIRARGSSGGHRGLQSIIAALGTQEFPRIRVGIGAATPPVNAVSHVLGRFSREELPLIETEVAAAADAVDCILAQGIDAAMSQFNT